MSFTRARPRRRLVVESPNSTRPSAPSPVPAPSTEVGRAMTIVGSDDGARPPGPGGEGENLSRELVCDLASGMAAATSLWAPHVRYGPGHRPVRLVASDAWEAWIVGWSDGHRVERHDHGLSAGAIAVIDGELTELRLDAGGVDRHRLVAGTVSWVPAGTVHELLASGRAASLHVYSRPLSSITRYDPDGRPRSTDPVHAPDPVVDLRSAARALHPTMAGGDDRG